MHTRSSEQMEGDGGACQVDASKETKAMDLDHQDDSEADSADANAVATSPDIAVQGDEKEHEGGEGSNGSKMDEDPVYAETHPSDTESVATSPVIAVQGDGKEHEGDEGSNGSKMDGDPVGAETHSADTNAVATSPVIAVQGNGKEQDGDEGSNGNKMDEDHVVADATQPEESAANVKTLSQVNGNGIIEGPVAKPMMVVTESHEQGLVNAPTLAHWRLLTRKQQQHIVDKFGCPDIGRLEETLGLERAITESEEARPQTASDALLAGILATIPDTLSATQDIEGQGGTPKDVHTPANGRDSNKSPRNKRGKKASCKYWNHITPIVISFFSS